MGTNKSLGLPWSLVAMDAVGAILLVLGILGAIGVDIGLPVLQTLWPFFIVLGLMLMAPIVVWAVRRARDIRGSGQD